jgi:hypothetical protein
VTGLEINITYPGCGIDSAQEPSGADFIALSYPKTNLGVGGGTQNKEQNKKCFGI